MTSISLVGTSHIERVHRDAPPGSNAITHIIFLTDVDGSEVTHFLDENDTPQPAVQTAKKGTLLRFPATLPHAGGASNAERLLSLLHLLRWVLFALKEVEGGSPYDPKKVHIGDLDRHGWGTERSLGKSKVSLF